MIGSNISTVRKDRKMTQVEFAKRIDISQNYLSQIESGSKEPSDIIVTAIAREFGVSKEWLYDGNGTPIYSSPSRSAAEIAKKYSFPDITKKLLEAYERLSEEQQAIVLEYARNFIASLIDGKDLEQAAGIATSQKEQPEI